jgi:hypothetical protein
VQTLHASWREAAQVTNFGGALEHANNPEYETGSFLSTDATERILTLPMMSARSTPAYELPDCPAQSIDTDEELLGRVQQRDKQALLLLFRRYRPLAFSIGCRILQDSGEAEDLVQEVFLRLHSKDNTFDASRGSARTWTAEPLPAEDQESLTLDLQRDSEVLQFLYGNEKDGRQLDGFRKATLGSVFIV